MNSNYENEEFRIMLSESINSQLGKLVKKIIYFCRNCKEDYTFPFMAQMKTFVGLNRNLILKA